MPLYVLSCLCALALGAQDADASKTQEKAKTTPVIEIAKTETKHHADLPTGRMDYTATASQIPLRNDDGETECRMFYVAYTKDGADPRKRPVTFAFNGGPGSATIWLHMGALGPKRAPMPDDGSLPAPPYEAVDNADTWLDFTDVVVVDAPATGFSRVAKPEWNKNYFGVRQDIRAFTNFVKGWLTEHKRWKSPLFIAGESYGGIRGSGLCNSLFGEGIAVSGFVSVSGTNNFMTLDGMRGNDLTYMGFLPSMAACAWYHHKAAPRFKSVEAIVAESRKWVDEVYGPALLRGDALGEDEKDKIAARMSEYLGVSKKYCLGSNLRVPEFAFFKELLRDDGLSIGRYDGRLTVKEELKVGGQDANDPSDDAVNAPFTSVLNDYFQSELGIKTTMEYRTGGNVYPWQEREGGYSETASDLRRVLAANPHLRVLYCCGYYDLACPLNATVYTVDHMGLDAETRKHLSFEFYPAGHMMYIEKSSRKKFHDDVKRFEEACLAGK
ncbi:MAG: peptidase S10 [Armatimonadetes bacterium]|nr:peptidase S10 [Armatimonadota bacterium]